MTPVNTVALVAGVVFGFMLAEQRHSRANERALRAAGAIEPPGDPYRALAVLYPLAFRLMCAEGAWRAAYASAAPAADAARGPSWAAAGVLLFAASKALKYWAIGALGERWSFRVLIQPGRPLVTSGPYRFLAHPNYLAVVGELVSTAMMVGATLMGPVMTAVFGAALWKRLRFEARAIGGAAAPR